MRTIFVISAAQDSILGPDLGDNAYDSILRSEMPEETALVEYADNFSSLYITLSWPSKSAINECIFLTLRNVRSWSLARFGKQRGFSDADSSRVKRQAALRVCFTYNIVYEPVVLVIAGDVPVELGEKGNLPETRRYRQEHCQIRRAFSNLTLVET
ncbi:hypothetical protein J6590_090175 [Homalodisca vitripennis]|nr:hypothetical protein J6590_090175 [Homalodisca vitripennis]